MYERVLIRPIVFFGLLSGSALAEPLIVPVRTGTAVSGAGSVDGSVVAYNPAGVSAAGNQYYGELGGRMMSLLLYSTRHEGIDPNTGEVYLPSSSSEIAPGGYLGATFSPAGSPLGFGLAIHTTSVQSVDFRGDESGPNYQTHQRYGLLSSDMRTTLLNGAVGLEPVDKLHLGVALGVGFDHVAIVQAWDPMGFEGLGPGDDEPGLTKPFSNDVLFSMDGQGYHLEYSGGLMWVSDRYSVGASYLHPSAMTPSGEGSFVIPPMLGGVTVPLLVDGTMPLAPLARIGLNARPLDWIEVSLNGEVALWELCCSGKDGDTLMEITDVDGNQVGHNNGVLSDISVENYIPLRLNNRLALQAGAEFRVNERLDIQSEVEWRQPSVSDYAVNALNLDFETLAIGGGLSTTLFRGVEVGVDFIEILSIPRLITNSAWDVRVHSLVDVDPNYVDERFSPQLPYTASGNGYYESVMRTFSVRVGGSY